MDKALQEFVRKLLGKRFGIGFFNNAYMNRVLNVSLKFCDFNPQTVSNLIMHHRKSQCDLYRSLGPCIPRRKTAFQCFLPLFPFCKMEVAVLPPLGEEWEGQIQEEYYDFGATDVPGINDTMKQFNVCR